MASFDRNCKLQADPNTESIVKATWTVCSMCFLQMAKEHWRYRNKRTKDWKRAMEEYTTTNTTRISYRHTFTSNLKGIKSSHVTSPRVRDKKRRLIVAKKKNPSTAWNVSLRSELPLQSRWARITKWRWKLFQRRCERASRIHYSYKTASVQSSENETQKGYVFNFEHCLNINCTLGETRTGIITHSVITGERQCPVLPFEHFKCDLPKRKKTVQLQSERNKTQKPPSPWNCALSILDMYAILFNNTSNLKDIRRPR